MATIQHRYLRPSSRLINKYISRNSLRNLGVSQVSSNTTTTTTTAILQYLSLTFDDIANASLMISGDASLVADWNTFFDLPTNGTPFTSVSIVGNTAKLYGGGNMTLSAYVFGDNVPTSTCLLEVVDNGGFVVACADGVFSDYDYGNGCYGLTKIDLPSCVTLSQFVFGDCQALVDLNLPFSSYTTLPTMLFRDCHEMLSFDFPNVTTVGDSCFYNCTSCTSINLPSCTTLVESSFQGCTSLASVDISSATTLGIRIFMFCSSINTINLPLATSIGNTCFLGCTSLTSILLPSCTTLGSTTGNDSVFDNIIGNTITLTISDALMYCNSGAPDGDIAYLQANDMVTITTSYPFASPNFVLKFDDIANASLMIGGDASHVADWNTFFTLPFYGTVFSSVEIVGQYINLLGGGNLTIEPALFGRTVPNATCLQQIIDVNGITKTLQDYTFTNGYGGYTCTGLVKVSFPSVTTIGYKSFSHCTGLKTANFTSAVTINDYIFEYCSSLTDLNIPSLVTAGRGCFSFLPIASLNLPLLNKVGSYSFSDSPNLTNISLPSLTISNNNIFKNCTGLTSVTMAIVVNLSYNTFMNCTSLATITLPLCTNLGGSVGNDGVFSGIIGNTITLTVPEALMTCNGGAPDGDIQYLQANNTVVVNPELALTFDDIANASLMISGDASLVADWNTFFDLPTNGTPFTSVSIVGNTAKLYGGANITFRDYVFGDNVPTNNCLLQVVDSANCIVACGNGVFSDYHTGVGCYGLTKIHLPACVTLGDAVFADCAVLSDVVLSFASFTSLGEDVFDYVPLLPDSVANQFVNLTTVGRWCFWGCASFVNPDFSKLTIAPKGCFNSCTGLINPNFSSLVTAGDQCFQYCTSLKSPDFRSLTSMGSFCFGNCPSLESPNFSGFITLPDNAFTWATLVNPNFDSLVSAGNMCFANCSSLSTDFPSLVTIGNACFLGCSSLVSPNFDSLQTTGTVCFVGCTSLDNLSLPSLLTLGDSSFQICTQLTNLSIPVCTALGSTTGDNAVFSGITGKTITLTVPSALMTCNGGSPDGDIQYLQANDTVTIIQV